MAHDDASKPAASAATRGVRTRATQLPAVRRLKKHVLIALGAAFVLEVAARLIHSSSAYHNLIADSISMIALLLLCGSALYLVVRLRDSRLLTWCMGCATVFLLLSQLINVAEDIPTVARALFSSGWQNPLEGLILLTGLILLIATLYLALFEAITVKGALIKERGDLLIEIRERKQAEAELYESQRQLRRLSTHMEKLREDERSHIAREVHDDLGQTMTSLKIELANLKRRLSPANDAVAEIIDSMEEQLNGTMQAVRRIITELRPGVLDDLGLLAAIEWQLRDFEKRAGLAYTLDAVGAEPALPRDTKTVLFRILQEALTNVARHARASHVRVGLAHTDSTLTMTIGDNGRGFDVATLDDRPSFGILGMRERAAQVAGNVTVDSTIDGGTTIIASVPLHHDRPKSETQA